MRRFLLAPVVLFVAGANCLPGDNDDACGLKSGKPDTPSGTLQATRDGNLYIANTGLRGYKGTDRMDIVAGDVTLYVGKDRDGKRVDEQVAAGKFPVCVLLHENTDGTGYAFVNATGSSYITDSSHTGTVAILAKEGDELLGRFEFRATRNSGGGTTTFEDGSFRLGPR
jgi:hypothetical protein